MWFCPYAIFRFLLPLTIFSCFVTLSLHWVNSILFLNWIAKIRWILRKLKWKKTHRKISNKKFKVFIPFCNMKPWYSIISIILTVLNASSTLRENFRLDSLEYVLVCMLKITLFSNNIKFYSKNLVREHYENYLKMCVERSTVANVQPLLK